MTLNLRSEGGAEQTLTLDLRTSKHPQPLPPGTSHAETTLARSWLSRYILLFMLKKINKYTVRITVVYFVTQPLCLQKLLSPDVRQIPGLYLANYFG